MDEDVPEEEVLAFLFFLSFPSFFSAMHKKRVSGAALALQQQQMLVIPPPSLVSFLPGIPLCAHLYPGMLCGTSSAHRGAEGSALVRTRPKWAQTRRQTPTSLKPGTLSVHLPQGNVKALAQGPSHLPWLLLSSICVRENRRSSSSVESCCPAASPCCSSSFSSPSSPACSGNRSCSCSCSVSASGSGCGPWQLLQGRGHSRATGGPTLPKSLQSNLSPGKPAPVNLPPCSHQSAGLGSPITAEAMWNFTNPQHGALGREVTQGQPCHPQAALTCLRRLSPSRFSTRNLPPGFPCGSAVCPWRIPGLVPALGRHRGA